MDVQTGSSKPARPKIVVVEYDPAARRSMQLLLQGHGFDVRTYVSGEALLIASTPPDPDCLVVDLRLDGADGIELLAAMRERGWTSPAILVTGYPSSDVSRRANDAGYAMIFEKPLRERSLVEAVGRLVRSPTTH